MARPFLFRRKSPPASAGTVGMTAGPHSHGKPAFLSWGLATANSESGHTIPITSILSAVRHTSEANRRKRSAAGHSTGRLVHKQSGACPEPDVLSDFKGTGSPCDMECRPQRRAHADGQSGLAGSRDGPNSFDSSLVSACFHALPLRGAFTVTGDVADCFF